MSRRTTIICDRCGEDITSTTVIGWGSQVWIPASDLCAQCGYLWAMQMKSAWQLFMVVPDGGESCA